MSVGVSLTRSLVRVAVGGRGSGASGTSQAHLSRCHLPGGDWRARWDRAREGEREEERGLRGKEGRLNEGEGGCREGAVRWGKEKGEFSQTGDAHFTMTGWVESREGKRGREGGRGDVKEGWGHMALFLQRTHKEAKWDG